MGISNRDFYHTPSSVGDWGSPGLTPVIKWLLIANIIVFVLQLLIVKDDQSTLLYYMRKADPEIDRLVKEAEKSPEAKKAVEKEHPEIIAIMDQKDDPGAFGRRMKISIVQEWLELDTNKVLKNGQVWRLLTSAFCHDRLGILHIIINMFFLIYFGCTIERMYGSREFLLFYLTAAIIASLTFMALDVYLGTSLPAVGASGAVLAVVMLYVVHFPHETFCIFWIQIELRWIILIYILFDLHPVVLALSGDTMASGVAHASHLGGLAFGYLYSRSSWRLEAMLDWRPSRRGRADRPRPRPTLERPGASDSPTGRVDSLLAKISQSGADSLTDEEREYLKRASERMKRRKEDPGMGM